MKNFAKTIFGSLLAFFPKSDSFSKQIFPPKSNFFAFFRKSQAEKELLLRQTSY